MGRWQDGHLLLGTEHPVDQRVTSSAECGRIHTGFYFTLKKIWNRMTASVLKEDQNTKKFKHLFNLTQTHSMQICGEISFVKPQNNT